MNAIYEKYGLKPTGEVPNERQLEWFSRERMVFFHFGMNTFTNKEWGDGSENPRDFNPTELDVRQWVRTIKETGFTAAIITAKHHDGFCLWQTAYTEHSIKNSPYKNGKGDIVKEFTDACAEYGIKACIYLSPWDRHEPTWGKVEYNDFYIGQLTELLTNYGEIYEVWWDGAGSTEAIYHWDKWAETVRRLQPKAVIFGSLGATPWVDVRWVGNERGIAGKPCYFTIDESSLRTETTSELNRGKLGGERCIPAEVDVSIRPGWFYHKEQNANVRPPENLVNLWFSSNGRGAGLLLNIPPDKRGLLADSDIAALREYYKILTDALNNNLALGARVTSDSEREGCEAKNLLSADKSLFYAASEENITPTVTVELGSETEINAFSISEAVELGHKVTGIKISALTGDGWQTVAENECVGYRWCEPFAPIKATAVKIEVTSAQAAPVLHSLGLYSFDNRIFEAKTNKNPFENLAKSEVASVKLSGNEVDANLGGLFPFNEIRINNMGKCKYQLYIFNGFSFDLYKEGESDTHCFICKLDETVDWAYRFKLVFTEGYLDPHNRIEVYNM